MDQTFYRPYKYLAARKEHDEMKDRPEHRQLNNIEVNRLFNIKKNNIDRYNKLKEGRISHYFPETVAKKIYRDKNSSQIVFGTDFTQMNKT